MPFYVTPPIEQNKEETILQSSVFTILQFFFVLLRTKQGFIS